jgi:nucleotide-binding universal stress UspA family protein
MNTYRSIMRNHPEAALGRLAEELQAAGGGQVAAVVHSGPEAETIVRIATDQASDLIVVGTTGRKEHLGSVAERVARTARRPVLVVPGPA